MTDYTELVKWLREHSKEKCNCDSCPYYDAAERGYGTCSEKLAEKAADAIEELSKERDWWKNECDEASSGSLAWVNVQEALPDGSEGDWVLAVAYGQTGNVRLEEAIVLAAFDPHAGWFLESEPEAPIHVTHWMPLPEPPKEET